MSEVEFSLPSPQVSKDLIERVQFSVSSRNAGAKVSECLTHVFVSPYCEDPKSIAWQYVSSGVTCLLRKKELAKNGRRMVWTVHMCLYNVTYGVLVWKGTITPNSCYTAVADNFHVYAMHELNAIVGLLFDETSQAREMLRSFLTWDAEKVKDERSKGESASHAAVRFRKEMISKPCNFQHIQGTQALDECMEIEKIKTDIQAAFFGLGPARGGKKDGELGSKQPSRGKRKKDTGKPRLQFQNISVPHKLTASRSEHTLVHSSKSLDVEMVTTSVPPLQPMMSVPSGIARYSMPMQTTVHHSNPDLLNGYQQQYYPAQPQPTAVDVEPDSPVPMVEQPRSPQYDSLLQQLHRQQQLQQPPQQEEENGLKYQPPQVDSQPSHSASASGPHSPEYVKPPLNGLKSQSPHVGGGQLQNGSDPHSPPYDSLLQNGTDPHSPAYDSLPQAASGPHSPAYDSLPQAASGPHSPAYDSLPQATSGPHSPAYDSLPQAASGPHSPAYDSLPQAASGPHSPAYDSLQKTERTHKLSSGGESSTGHASAMLPELFVDTVVDNEVAGYSAVGASQGSDGGELDYPLPGRLSPLNFEKEFSQSAFFQPAFVTSMTNC